MECEQAMLHRSTYKIEFYFNTHTSTTMVIRVTIGPGFVVGVALLQLH
jgi:hypothetical protein